MSTVPAQNGLAYPYGKPALCGSLKQQPADFLVTEELGFPLTGQGEHLFLYVEKNSLTTPQLVTALAEQVGIRARDIGYSGLKDKHAITRQWVSLHLPGYKEIPEIAQTEHYRLLQSSWHDKKLRVGAHRSNRFEIVLRDVGGDASDLPQRLDDIRRFGFANYFGEQRFGQAQDNVDQALRALNNRHKSRRLSRSKKSLYLSALRSELFNRILSSRIEANIWQQPLEGDLWMLAGSHSVFSEVLDGNLLQRYQGLDIHSAISLYGRGDSRLKGLAEQMENSVFEDHSAICDTLLKHEVKRSSRANRAIASNLEVNFDAENALIHVQVELEKGVYLTTLVNHLVRTSGVGGSAGRSE